ncbi:MAG: SDR family NAD(P)-dependent oxidoreductase [Rhodobacteraceae bacterium]|nr:SDR family NAD(P)-dependent oxidoreductase [Paracoccaceae bacterium]
MHVLITGANRGIGAILAAKAQMMGYQVIGTARDLGTLDESIDWIQLDVTSTESVQNFTKSMQGRPLDMLICNAGVYPDKGQNQTDITAEMFAAAFQVNTIGVWQTIQATLPNLRASKGKIAIISSKMGSSTRAPGGSYAYRASKAAATNLACNLASDLKPEGIAVGSYHPGWVRTDMGGDNADISLNECTNGLWDRFTKLSLKTTGVFEGYDGEPLPF